MCSCLLPGPFSSSKMELGLEIFVMYLIGMYHCWLKGEKEFYVKNVAKVQKKNLLYNVENLFNSLVPVLSPTSKSLATSRVFWM